MDREIGRIYKHGKSQLSNLSIKEPIFSSSASQKSYSIKLTITSVSYVIYKEQTDSVLCSQNIIQNDLNITNNDSIHSCEIPRKKNRITTTLNPNHHEQRIGVMSMHSFNLHITAKLPPASK